MNNETTASQPKSIGDDAQFLDWLKAWSHEYENRLRDSDVDDITKQVAAYIDSRAPAAQASAIIQAAPVGQYANEMFTILCRIHRVDKTAGYRTDLTDSVEELLTRIVATPAATIQEPVMVAEPVDAVRTELGRAAFDAAYRGYSSSETWNKSDSACHHHWTHLAGHIWRAAYAAPMVAEPAGATPEMVQWRNIRKVVAAVADFCFGSKDDPVYGAAHCAVTTCLTAKDGVQVTLEPLAATVKAVPSEALSGAARDVLAERQRQVETEGWTPEHDDMHDDGQMAVAAGFYALQCGYPHERTHWRHGEAPMYWPWAASWWKPTTKRANLIKAGALILAEIERIDRAAPLADKTGGGE